MWVPPEDVDPVVLHAPTRKSVSVFGAVQIATGKLVTMITSTFDAITFQTFLELLVSHEYTSLPLHTVLDNSRYHRAVVLQQWLKMHDQEIILDFLPPYSPQLNPIERVWKLVRRLQVHNRYFPTLEGLTQALIEQFGIWKEPNDTLRKLCGII